MKIRIAVLLAWSLSLPAAAQSGMPDGSSMSLWEGSQLFCKNCHGRAGEGAFGPDLAGRGLSASQFRQAVRKPWGVMPAFTEEQLSDTEIDDLAAWFASMPKVAQTGSWRVPVASDAPHSQQLYMAAGCAQCHGPTFDQPRAALGQRNGDFALFKDLVYTHTTAMPKFEEQRPGQRLRMGNFNSLRLSESALREIFDWAHDEMGFRPALQAQLIVSGGAGYALTINNNGEEGKGLSAQGLVIDIALPAGVTVIATTGAGYKGVHTDAQTKNDVVEWTVPRLAPKQSQIFTLTLSQAPSSPSDLKGTIHWAKPGPRTGPNRDAVNFAVRQLAPPRP